MDGSILAVLLILSATVLLLVTDLIRIDLVAIIAMLLLGLTGILSVSEVFSGFSSNAVIAMIGVMMMSHGLARTGIIDRISGAIVNKTGNRKAVIVLLISLLAGMLSGVLITVGVAALFLPVMLQISRRKKYPASDLMIPMGFSAILGANLTMVGSAPLILLNDLLRSNEMEPYSLFSVAPVGLLLLAAGLVYFFFLSRHVLPGSDNQHGNLSYQDRLMDTLSLSHQISHYYVPQNSALINRTVETAGLWQKYHLHLLAIAGNNDIQYVPWRHSTFQPGQKLALLGDANEASRFSDEYNLMVVTHSRFFKPLEDFDQSGFCEVIIPPRSEMAGCTLREFSLRRKYSVEPLILFSSGTEVRDDFSDHRIKQGDTLVVYGLWQHIKELDHSEDFIVAGPSNITERNPRKTIPAAAALAGAILMTLIGFPVSLSFFTGSVIMILSGVMNIRQAYKAIDWKVIFLLASLIPLGLAMQKTGTAALIADWLITIIQGKHLILLLAVVAFLASFFALFISNVGTVVVLVPLVISMAAMEGIDPRPVALLAAVCASNAFILPTHQVNALLQTPGGYRNADYIKAGFGITVLYLVISVTFFYFIIV